MVSLSVEEDYALLTYFQSASSSSSVVAAAGETDQAKLQAACKPHELLLYIAKPSQAASRIYALWADRHWNQIKTRETEQESERVTYFS